MTTADLEYTMKLIEAERQRKIYASFRRKVEKDEIIIQINQLKDRKVTDVCDSLLFGLDRMYPNGAINHEVGSIKAGLTYLSKSCKKEYLGYCSDRTILELFLIKPDVAIQLAEYTVRTQSAGIRI